VLYGHPAIAEDEAVKGRENRPFTTVSPCFVPWAYWYAVAPALIADRAGTNAKVRRDCRNWPALVEIQVA